MNASQRRKNRATAGELARQVRAKTLARHLCEHCGEYGGHWIQAGGLSLMALIEGRDDSHGFWTCQPKAEKAEGMQ